MSDFWIYFTIGLRHVLNINAYDHILFLLVLVAPFVFKEWKNVLLLVTIFTVGHTLALFLSVFELITVKEKVAEFLIPVTIFFTASYNIIVSKKIAKKSNLSIIGFVTLFFGLIHGLGFSYYFNSILPGNPTDKIFPLLQFTLGIEAAQAIVVFTVLIISLILQNFFRVSKRDFVLLLSAFVLGVVTPMLLQNKIWS